MCAVVVAVVLLGFGCNNRKGDVEVVIPSCEDTNHTPAEIQEATQKAMKRMESEGYKVTPALWEDEKGWAKVMNYTVEILKCDPNKPSTKPAGVRR
ncbi:hypothetical protein A3H11_04585 [Candidatus Uhrbacteria bacterium RIFCSPLOWO2_12_FULL_47_10]|nr:MAG: hypothetical protein A3H11_04585 [Candidatus Uhrbacteria bacterium RIFCSPLOWO2_12_FULL_47_10]